MPKFKVGFQIATILGVIATGAWAGPIFPGQNMVQRPSMDGLIERRSLSPQRFDHFHPQLGPILERAETLRTLEASGIQPGSLLPDNPRFQALHARRDLHPTRFDHFHPLLGILLAEDRRLQDWTLTDFQNPLDPIEPIIPPVVFEPPPITPPPLGFLGEEIGIPALPGGGGIWDSSNPLPPPPTGPAPIAVPEPTTLVLALLGSPLLAWAAWRKRRQVH